jgi:hypothetical protein
MYVHFIECVDLARSHGVHFCLDYQCSNSMQGIQFTMESKRLIQHFHTLPCSKLQLRKQKPETQGYRFQSRPGSAKGIQARQKERTIWNDFSSRLVTVIQFSIQPHCGPTSVGMHAEHTKKADFLKKEQFEKYSD